MHPNELITILRESITPDFKKIAEGGVLKLIEQHDNGKSTLFEISASAIHFAFSLDTKGFDPFPIFENKVEGLKSRNDLIICCQSEQEIPLVFLFELKSKNSKGAGHQLRCGQAFCEYLFKLLRIKYIHLAEPRYFAVLVKQPRFPPKGKTKAPKIKFQLTNGLLLCEWDVSTKLLLTNLIKKAIDNG